MAFEISQYQQNLGEGEVWLPSAAVSSPKKRMLEDSGCEHQFPCEFPYEWGSSTLQLDLSLCSPGLSTVGLSETDEEDDYMAGLAERVAYSMLDDDDNYDEKLDIHTMKWPSEQSLFVDHDKPKCIMARSSQSAMGGSTGCWSTVSTKAVSPTLAGNSAWELFNMAGDQAVRLSMLNGDESSEGFVKGSHRKMPVRGLAGGPGGRRNSGCFHPPVQWKQNAVPSVANKDFQHTMSSFSGVDSTCNAARLLQRTWSSRIRTDDDRNLAQQCQQPGQCPVSGMGRQAKAAYAQPARSRPCGNKKATSRSTPACLSGQAGGGSGMRAVFLGSNGSGRESGGTGVFLPRRMDNGSLLKKPACSTVLLPARIVQALNLNVEDLRSQPCGLPEASPRIRDYERTLDHHSDSWCEQQNATFHPIYSQIQTPSEISLPQEWTY